MVADCWRNGDDETLSRTNGSKEAASKSDVGAITGASDNESNAMGPPLKQTSTKVF
jgi:hypothetical protein